MRPASTAGATLCAALLLCGCTLGSRSVPIDSPTKGFPGPQVEDSVYQAVDRATPAPEGYGLYSVLLTRAADRRTIRALSELFVTTGQANEAAIERANLNLIVIPVKSVSEAERLLGPARNDANATATALMQTSYDFNQAVKLMASVCRPERGAAVMRACGSTAPDGPLLVTAQRPLGGDADRDQRLLVVNLATTPPEAIGEVLAVYRRQIKEKDFTRLDTVDGWRLRALNVILDAAQLLPGISKAYADSK